MKLHNPWRALLEGCMTGDNYLSAQEWHDLIGELDELYRYRCGQHEALNVAYANGRDAQREDDDERCARICDDEFLKLMTAAHKGRLDGASAGEAMRLSQRIKARIQAP